MWLWPSSSSVWQSDCPGDPVIPTSQDSRSCVITALMWTGLGDLFLRSSTVMKSDSVSLPKLSYKKLEILFFQHLFWFFPTACSDESHCHVRELPPGEAQLSRAEGGPWPTAFEELNPSNSQVSELGSGSFPSWTSDGRTASVSHWHLNCILVKKT